jgi:hypothetical protein
VGVHVSGPDVSLEVGRVAEGSGADGTEEGQPQVQPLHVLQHVVPDRRPLCFIKTRHKINNSWNRKRMSTLTIFPVQYYFLEYSV